MEHQLISAYASEVFVNMLDFKLALTTVGPSMQRGFQVQVEKMNWNDVGGLENVKKVCVYYSKRIKIYIT